MAKGAGQKLGTLYFDLGLNDDQFAKDWAKTKAKYGKAIDLNIPISFNTKQVKTAATELVSELKKTGGINLSKPMSDYQDGIRKAKSELKLLMQMQREALASNKAKLGWADINGSTKYKMEPMAGYNKEIDATAAKIKHLESLVRNLKSVAPMLGKGTGQIGSSAYYSAKDEGVLKGMSAYYKELERETASVARNEALINKERNKTTKTLIKNREKQDAADIREKAAATKQAERETIAYAKAQDRAYQSAIKARMGSKSFNDQIALTNKTMMNSRQMALQLSNQFGTMFSIYAVERFVSKLLEVRGAFEMQQVSLRAILQDAPAADRIFAQVKALAVESPFTFLDLVSYTKQLSAFSVPVNELFSTMKSLADVSAGLGVDMGRITLAFGQVKAASVLRGQELRQFTEAGIPLVAELANKFSELEGRTVSAGEVFDKISKRMVSSGMVKGIFDDLTSAGGKFYEMQEKQALSLQGKISNLKDSFEIMLNSVGAANDDILKGGVDGLTELIRNWKEVLNIIGAVVFAYGTYKAVLLTVAASERALIALAATQRFIALARAITGASAATVGFGVAMRAAGGPLVWIATAIAAIVAGLALFINKAESSVEMIERINTEGAKVQDFSNKVDKLVTSYDELSRKASLSESEQNKLNITIKELGGLFPTAVTGINSYGEATAIATEKIKAFNEEQKKAVTNVAIASKAELNVRKRQLEEAIKKDVTLKDSPSSVGVIGGYYGAPSIRGKQSKEEVAVIDKNLIKLRAELMLVNTAMSQQDEIIKSVTESTLKTAASFASLTGWAKNFYDATKGKTGLIAEITPENLSGDVSDFKKKLQDSYNEVKSLYDIMAMSKKGIYSAEEISTQKKSLDAYEYALGVLGGSKQALKADAKDEKDANKIFVDNLKERISAIKEAYKWYTDLSKAGGDTVVAKASAKASVKKSFPDVAIEDGGIGVNLDRLLNSEALKKGSAETKAVLQDLVNYKRELGMQELSDKTQQLEEVRKANMTFLQKMEGEARKYKTDVSLLGTDTGAIGERGVKYNETVNAIEEEYAKRSQEYKDLMLWIVDMSIAEVQSEMQSVMATLKSGHASSPEQQAAWHQMYLELEKKYNELVANKAKVDKDTSYKDFKKTVTALNNVQSAVDDLIGSFDNMDAGVKATLTAISATATGTIKILEGISAASAAGIGAAEKASVILTVIAAAIQILAAIIKAFSDAEKDRQAEIQKSTEEYMTMLDVLRDINAELRDISTMNIFGDDAWAKGKTAVMDMSASLKDFKNIMDGIVSKSVNLWSKGGGPDLMSIMPLFGDAGSSMLNMNKADFEKSASGYFSDLTRVFKDFDYAAAKALSASGKLSSESQVYVDGLISAYEDYKTAITEMSDYLSGVFGSVGSSIMDSITENMGSVKDAVDDMTGYVSDALWQMVEDIAYSKYFATIFGSIQNEILAAMGDANPNDATQSADIFAKYMGSLGTATEDANAYMTTLKDYLAAAGFDVTAFDKSTSSPNSLRGNIENIKESTATKLEGYIAGLAQNSVAGRYQMTMIASALTDDGIMIKSEGLMQEVRENIGAMRLQMDVLARVAVSFESCMYAAPNGKAVRIG